MFGSPLPFSRLIGYDSCEEIETSDKSNQMITITFANREVEKRALAFLLGRFSGRVSKSGEHLVPVAALEALADQGIPFTVEGKAIQQ